MDSINLMLRALLIRTSDNPRSREMISAFSFYLVLASPVVSTQVPSACQWLVEPAPRPMYRRRCPTAEDVRIGLCRLHHVRLGSHHTATWLAGVRPA